MAKTSFVVALILYNLGHAAGSGFDTDAACRAACLNVLSGGAAECYPCLLKYVDESKVDPGHMRDTLMMQLVQKDLRRVCNGYSEANPTGWTKKSTAGKNGKPRFTGCEVRKGIFGEHTTVYGKHSQVKKLLKAFPRRYADGSVWRGNEAFMILPSRLWEAVNPAAVFVGMAPQQHRVIRPIMEEVLACKKGCTEEMEAQVKAFFEKEEIKSIYDVKLFFWEMLFKRAFPGEEATMAALGTENMRQLYTAISAISPVLQVVPEDMAEQIAAPVLAGIDQVMPVYEQLVLKHYGERLAGTSCLPTVSCNRQLAATFFGMGMIATFSDVLSTALWTLTADKTPHGDTFPEHLQVTEENAHQFFLENVRFFGAATEAAYWPKPPARAYDETASQTEGGKRTVLNFFLAQRDPNVWGENAHKFRLRPLHVYKKNFVGFADFARDRSVEGGLQNRACPGKSLALTIGRLFALHYKPAEWEAQGVSSHLDMFPPFVGEFTLTKKAV